LAWKLSVTPGTVARAYQIVTSDGLLEATIGRGTFVVDPTTATLPARDSNWGEEEPSTYSSVVDLRSPRLPDVGQSAVLSRILTGMAAVRASHYLDYPMPRDDLALCQAYCEWIASPALGPINAGNIAVTSGGQNGLMISLQCCLRGDRPSVLCEELAFPGFRRTARLNRADVAPVAMDDEGMLPDALDQAVRRTGARVLFLMPDAQNPTTAQMSLQRRLEISDVARLHDLQIIEDNCYSVAPTSLPSLYALAPDRTWHISSFSKSLSAGLRFGAIIAPTGLADTARLAMQHNSFGLSRPVADIALELMRSGEAVRLRDLVVADIDKRLKLAVNILGRHALRWRRGLSFVWLPMPRGWRGASFARAAEAQGILVRTADEYSLADGRAPNAVRIALSGGISEDALNRSLLILAGILDNPDDFLPV
ncbi:MAG: PLP-dependent aminotransferase family protein, partial [Paracoccaceae bacterium]